MARGRFLLVRRRRVIDTETSNADGAIRRFGGMAHAFALANPDLPFGKYLTERRRTLLLIARDIESATSTKTDCEVPQTREFQNAPIHLIDVVSIQRADS